jgi:hypothetical protein
MRTTENAHGHHHTLNDRPQHARGDHPERQEQPVMSQEMVERFLGRILTDGVLRKRFFADRERRLAEIELLDHEREGLLGLDRYAVERLAACLDARIVRG